MPAPTIKRFVRVNEAKLRLGVSHSTFYRLVKSDPRFPRILKIGSSSVLDDDALTAYQEAIIAEADAA